MLSGSMSLLPLTLPVIARVVAEDSSEAFAVGVVEIVVAVECWQNIVKCDCFERRPPPQP